MLDPTVASFGDAERATDVVIQRIAWRLQQERLDVIARRDGAVRELAIDLDALHIAVRLAPVERFAERHQWRIRFRKSPPFDQLDDEGRLMLRSLHESITELMIAAEETEDVDVASIAS